MPRGRVPDRKATARVAAGCKPMRRAILLTTAFAMLEGCNSAPKILSQSSRSGVQPTVNLAVTVNGKTIKEGDSVQVKPGEALELKVAVTHLDQTTSDVTDDAKTKVFSESPGVISVGPHGRVVVVTGGLGEFGLSSTGAVGISYGSPGDKELGVTSVPFEIKSGKSNRGGLAAVADRASLGVGESARIKVLRTLPDGNTDDISADPQTLYLTTSDSALIPEGDGLVTCVGTGSQPTDRATITVFNGRLFSQIAFELRSRGPGPTLKIETNKTVMTEAEVQKFSVIGQNQAQLTARATGTRYVVFGGRGSAEKDLLFIDDQAGTITAESSLGPYNRRSVILFARNGDSVGWK